MCNKYNGWSNYPTWCAKLWIDNDEGLQNTVSDMAQSCIIDTNADEMFSKTEKATIKFADELDDFIGEMLSENLPSELGLDLFNWAFGQVDWYEIAKVIIEDEIKEDSE